MHAATNRRDWPSAHSPRTRTHRAFVAVLGALLLTLGAAGAAFAQTTYTWNGGASACGPPQRVGRLCARRPRWTTSSSSTRAVALRRPLCRRRRSASCWSRETRCDATDRRRGCDAHYWGGTGVDLSVPAGSSLTQNTPTNVVFSVSLLTGATGSIGGNYVLTGGTGTANHTLLAADAAAITFTSGAIFTQGPNAGSNAFGAAAPAGTIVFNSGATLCRSPARTRSA